MDLEGYVNIITDGKEWCAWDALNEEEVWADEYYGLVEYLNERQIYLHPNFSDEEFLESKRDGKYTEYKAKAIYDFQIYHPFPNGGYEVITGLRAYPNGNFTKRAGETYRDLQQDIYKTTGCKLPRLKVIDIDYIYNAVKGYDMYKILG